MMRKSLSLAASLLGSAWLAFAQCPMCRNAAAAQGERAARALDLGILILFVPAVAIFCGVYFVAVRHRNHPDGNDE